MTNRHILRSENVLLPDGFAAADVVIEAGLIGAVNQHGIETNQQIVKDLGTCALLPGLVDPHVHLNEPGRTQWEGFATGTAAAKAGGVTSLVDMPLNSSPVTTTVAALEQKQRAARSSIHVDVGFHAGVIPSSANQIDSLVDAGALAAKAFLCPSGIDEFPNATERELRIAMPALAERDVPILVHAELIHAVAAMKNPRRYAEYLESRPRSFERAAIEMMIGLAREIHCHVHIVHLSDADSLPIIEQARSDGVRLTVETCPHYLFFCAESIPDGHTQYKCAPPIRDRENCDRLWAGLRNGLIDMIVSDHSPCPPSMKRLDSGRFDEAWGGISSLQLGLPVVWTEARRRGFSLENVVDWMSVQPARLVKLPQGIAVGNRAHLVAFDPDRIWTVDQTKLLHRHPITPYHDAELTGAVRDTWVHGDAASPLKGQLL